jgi:hypothetical protein
MEDTVLEGVLGQLPEIQRSQFVKTILMHEYFRGDQVTITSSTST